MWWLQQLHLLQAADVCLLEWSLACRVSRDGCLTEMHALLDLISKGLGCDMSFSHASTCSFHFANCPPYCLARECSNSFKSSWCSFRSGRASMSLQWIVVPEFRWSLSHKMNWAPTYLPISIIFFQLLSLMRSSRVSHQCPGPISFVLEATAFNIDQACSGALPSIRAAPLI